jgi:hypothetical protein
MVRIYPPSSTVDVRLLRQAPPGGSRGLPERLSQSRTVASSSWPQLVGDCEVAPRVDQGGDECRGGQARSSTYIVPPGASDSRKIDAERTSPAGGTQRTQCRPSGEPKNPRRLSPGRRPSIEPPPSTGAGKTIKPRRTVNKNSRLHLRSRCRHKHQRSAASAAAVVTGAGLVRCISLFIDGPPAEDGS